VALANITDYFNSFRTMEGEFVQVGPRGEQSEGVFVIAKPGKVRFHYKPPVKLDVIADGRSIAIRDNKANTQDLYPLSKTPLRYLLAQDVDLTSSKIVDGIKEDRDLISVLIEERSALVEGKLTLIFDRQSYELRQWIVTDAQGLNTSVAIFNTVTGKKPDPALFKIYLTTKKSNRPDR
jgi:outer membrane lipoprotein-sorting protein